MTRDTGRLAVFMAHRAALIELATPIVGDRARAEDLVQEAFLRFDPPEGRAPAAEQPVAYLYRIVRNLAIDWTRRRAVEQRGTDADPVWWMLPEAPRTPEQEAQHAEDLARVAAVLERLPPGARLAVEMHRLGGYTLDEIAARLGGSAPTAHRLVRDALLEIARGLGPQD